MGLAASCMANPGPAPTVEPETPTTTTPTSEKPTPKRSEVSVGVDPLRNGLNPHLLSDTSALVDSIAELVLPSAFVDGQVNRDLLTEVTVLEGEASTSEVVQTVRYEINPEAQWSDGTPITGADFTYLWQSLKSTPGAIEPAGYRAISGIRTSNAGRTVDVDFSTRVEDYSELFGNLLPSHLGGDFATSFYPTIGAGGGRFLIDSVDRARGVIQLHRNDRFWGESPARLDILRLRTVNSVTQGVDLLRSGQVAFVDQIPSETMVEAYELLPGAQTRLIDGPRTLQLDLNTSSELLADADTRRSLVGLLDLELIARQAAGRSSNLIVPTNPNASSEETPTALIDATKTAPLRIGADPADKEASAAVRAIADLLTREGLTVEIVTTDIPHAAGKQLPAGELDAFVSRARTDGSLNQLASSYPCPPKVRLSNLSGYCAPDGDALTEQILGGELDKQQAQAAVSALNEREWLTVGLLGERRVVVLGEGIVGANEDFNEWTSGLGSAATWRLEE